MQRWVFMTAQLDDFTVEELDLLLQHLDELDEDEQVELLQIAETLEDRQQAQESRDDLIAFCKLMMSDYKVGSHHRKLAQLLMQIESGEKDRITVSIAPRHGKSLLTSVFFPAWYLGRNPTKQVMMVSHTGDLAVDFGRKVRNLIDSEAYRKIFPHVTLATDSKSAGRWNTNKGGVYYATGVGSSIAGRGADLLLVDDAISEQDILTGGLEVLNKVYEWFTYGARTRLMPGAAVAIIGTRWHQGDLIGRVIKDMTMNPDADQYEVFEFPAILEVPDPEDPEQLIEKALWPEFFDLEALRRTKASMPAFQWSAQYMQKPTSEEGAIVKRTWWRRWTKERPPQCEFLIMSLDSAAEKHNRADFSVFTVWGVFMNEEEDAYQIILLNVVRDRMEFPELKSKALELYKEWEPDSFIVEKKSSGVAIYQELRRTGIPVQEFTPHRGTGDKHARLSSVADMISSGMVWVPETRWADELVEEIAAFPFGEHDDQVDATVMSLMRFRQGGFIRLPGDAPEEEQMFRQRRGGYY
jgi:predicted phage terminase large subunit-like protein